MGYICKIQANMIQVQKFLAHFDKKKPTNQSKFFSFPVDLSEICDFSKIAVFKDFGGHFEIRVTGTILGVNDVKYYVVKVEIEGWKLQLG